MTRSNIILVVAIVGTVCLSLVQIIFSSAFATDGIELTKLQTAQATLETENSLLRERVYTASSLTTIVAEAEKMGYTEDEKSRLILSSPLPIALNQ